MATVRALIASGRRPEAHPEPTGIDRRFGGLESLALQAQLARH